MDKNDHKNQSLWSLICKLKIFIDNNNMLLFILPKHSQNRGKFHRLFDISNMNILNFVRSKYLNTRFDDISRKDSNPKRYPCHTTTENKPKRTCEDNIRTCIQCTVKDLQIWCTGIISTPAGNFPSEAKYMLVAVVVGFIFLALEYQ